MEVFTRICVDLDQHGQPIGTSWERHVDGTRIEFGTGTVPGPFDTCEEAFGTIIAECQARFGFAAMLFSPVRSASTPPGP
jgi:hypothetical protein